MIRKITANDKDIFIHFAKDFYSSEAVCHKIPEEYYIRTFNELMRSDAYAQCYIFEDDGKTVGYALTAKTFSQEAGGMVIWIEEIYVVPHMRCKGMGKEFFRYIYSVIDESVTRIRLEICPDNKRAALLYKNAGFENMEYLQMVNELNNYHRQDYKK